MTTAKSEYRKPRNRLFVETIESVGAVGEGDNEEALITFWKRRDDLEKPAPPTHVEKVFKEQLDLFRQTKREETMSSDETVKEAIEAVVKRWTFGQHMTRFGKERGITEEMIRAELWKSEPGQQLTALLRSEYASEPIAKVRATIRKSGQHAEALRMIDEGIPS